VRYQRMLRQVVRLGLVVFLMVGCTAVRAEPTATPTPIPPTPIPTPMALPRLDGQRALFVAYVHFEPDEYEIPRDILEDLGVVTAFASISLDPVVGNRGVEVQPDLVLPDVTGSDYGAIIFLGGRLYKSNDPEAQRITHEALAAGNVVAAICFAPITLARADVIRGKRVTAGYLNPKFLREAGAIYTDAPVERDGLIITANGPDASRAFGEEIALALAESPEARGGQAP
jgi:protease I